MRMIKKLYGIVLICIEKTMGVDNAKQFDAYLRFHRRLNLKKPTTLAEKVCYIELHKQTTMAATCTDKYEVRNYIQTKGLGDILIPLVGGPWSNIEDIEFDSLATPLVFKGTHGCKMNYYMKDHNSFDIKACKKEMKRWLRTTYGTYSVEPHYKSIPHRIYAEKYLGEQSALIDYKFHCMNGEPVFILAVRDRISNGDHKMKESRELYDIQWNPIKGLRKGQTKIEDYNIIKPTNFEKMVTIAKELSKDFSFVRVDLYNIDGDIYFGELTFTPTGGVFSSYTDQFLTDMGNCLVIK